MDQFNIKCHLCSLKLSIEMLSALVCGHTFHRGCIRQYLQKSEVCPECQKTASEDYLVEKLVFKTGGGPRFANQKIDPVNVHQKIHEMRENKKAKKRREKKKKAKKSQTKKRVQTPPPVNNEKKTIAAVNQSLETERLSHAKTAAELREAKEDVKKFKALYDCEVKRRESDSDNVEAVFQFKKDLEIKQDFFEERLKASDLHHSYTKRFLHELRSYVYGGSSAMQDQAGTLAKLRNNMIFDDDIWLKILRLTDPYTVCRFSRTCGWSKTLVYSHTEILPQINVKLRIEKQQGVWLVESEMPADVRKATITPYSVVFKSGICLATILPPTRFFSKVTIRLGFNPQEYFPPSVGEVEEILMSVRAEEYHCEFKSHMCAFKVNGLSRVKLMHEIRWIKRAVPQFYYKGFDGASSAVCDAFQSACLSVRLNTIQATSALALAEFFKMAIYKPSTHVSLALLSPIAKSEPLGNSVQDRQIFRKQFFEAVRLLDLRNYYMFGEGHVGMEITLKRSAHRFTIGFQGNSILVLS